MKGLYKFHFDCGRQGTLKGLFISSSEFMKILVEEKIHVHFGEVLGKHSEISGCIEECDYTLVSEDPKVIEVIEDNDLTFGFDPFSYTIASYDMNLDKYGLTEETIIKSEVDGWDCYVGDMSVYEFCEYIKNKGN